VVAALAHLLAHGLAHFGNAVGKTHGEVQRIAAVAARAVVGAPTPIAVATGRAERLAGDEQPRTGQQPLVACLLEAPIGAAGITHGRKAAIQHGAHQHGGARRHQRQRHVLEPRQRYLRQHDVHMAVDQSRHQRAATTIDYAGVRRGDGPLRDLPDLVAFDQQLVAADQLVVLGVEHREVLEQILRHGRDPPLAAGVSIGKSRLYVNRALPARLRDRGRS